MNYNVGRAYVVQDAKHSVIPHDKCKYNGRTFLIVRPPALHKTAVSNSCHSIILNFTIILYSNFKLPKVISLAPQFESFKQA